MTSRPTPEAVTATARTAGLDLPPATAQRIAVALAPAFEVFAGVSPRLTFDLEPAGFVVAQLQGARRTAGGSK